MSATVPSRSNPTRKWHLVRQILPFGPASKVEVASAKQPIQCSSGHSIDL